MYTESKLHTTASSQENPAALYESGGEWDTIDLTTSQVKNLDKLEEATMKAFQAFIKEELESDEDVQYMGTLVSGSYEGICSLAESIKEEFMSPSDLEAYSKSAIGDEEKLVLVKEKICNVYDVWNVYSKEHLEELLNGPHGSRYHQNIAHVERLKASISHGQKEDVSTLDKLEGAERNADKVDTNTDKKSGRGERRRTRRARKVEEEKRQNKLEEGRKVAEFQEKEAAEARNAEGERRQNELEEARTAAELQEKEAAEARNVEEERRQNELEEARIVAELQEKE